MISPDTCNTYFAGHIHVHVYIYKTLQLLFILQRQQVELYVHYCHAAHVQSEPTNVPSLILHLKVHPYNYTHALNMVKQTHLVMVEEKNSKTTNLPKRCLVVSMYTYFIQCPYNTDMNAQLLSADSQVINSGFSLSRLFIEFTKQQK